MYTLFKNGLETETFDNLYSILDYLRNEMSDDTIYVDDTETSVENLVEEAVDYPVQVEYDGTLTEMYVLEFEVK